MSTSNGVQHTPSSSCTAPLIYSTTYQITTGTVDIYGNVPSTGSLGTCTFAYFGAGGQNANANHASVGDYSGQKNIEYGLSTSNATGSGGAIVTYPLSLFGAFHVYSVGIPPTLTQVSGDVDYNHQIEVTNSSTFPTPPLSLVV